MKKKVFFFSILVVAAVGVELWIRSQGIVDFPIYDTDEGIGYIPKAGQAGSYLNRFPWLVNERNMTAGPWKPNEKPDLLLIGDSIVWGGEEYRHEERSRILRGMYILPWVTRSQRHCRQFYAELKIWQEQGRIGACQSD